jgi:hypothetical protein
MGLKQKIGCQHMKGTTAFSWSHLVLSVFLHNDSCVFWIFVNILKIFEKD